MIVSGVLNSGCERSGGLVRETGQKRLSCRPAIFTKKLQKSREIINFTAFCGGPNRDRTDDLTDANRTLSQLSYRPIFGCFVYFCSICLCSLLFWPGPCYVALALPAELRARMQFFNTFTFSTRRGTYESQSRHTNASFSSRITRSYEDFRCQMLCNGNYYIMAKVSLQLFFQFFSLCAAACLQKSFMQQKSHFGERAIQTARPCNTKRWQKSFDSSGGRIARRSFSTL